MSERTITGELDVIRAIAETVRRVTAAREEEDSQGVATVWHQGSHRTELLSWVQRDAAGRPTILRQQLSVMGLVVDWRDQGALRTGQARKDDENSSASLITRPQFVDYEPTPRPRTLEIAAVLLRQVPRPDRYTEHLRRLVDPAGAPALHPVVDTSGPQDSAAEAEPGRKGGLAGILGKLIGK